jgi:hypothetical protein
MAHDEVVVEEEVEEDEGHCCAFLPYEKDVAALDKAVAADEDHIDHDLNHDDHDHENPFDGHRRSDHETSLGDTIHYYHDTAACFETPYFEPDYLGHDATRGAHLRVFYP